MLSDGPSHDRAEAITRECTEPRQRRRLRRETIDSPVPAYKVHSQASSMPSRSTCTTVSNTELTVKRPRQTSAGSRDAVLPSQNITRKMGN